MHIQLFVDDPDPLQRLITVEAVRPSRLAQVAELAAALASIPATGGVIALRASEAERQTLEAYVPLSVESSRVVYASTPTPAPSTGSARALERLRGQHDQQAALYAATPALPETRQQRRARARQRT